jgi:hypothetical protein
VWLDTDEAAFLAKARNHLHLPLLALWTDQRQGDLLRLPWFSLRRQVHQAVTIKDRRASQGCTEAEIATLTGHSLRNVRAILDAHYLHHDPALAESAIKKLETRTKSQTVFQTVPECSGSEGQKV